MKIEHTYLCLDCDELFQPRDQGGKAECPACTSRSCAPISGWITSWSAYDNGVSGKQSAVNGNDTVYGSLLTAREPTERRLYGSERR